MICIVLRMLSDYVGEDKFLKGVSLYLKKRLYGNSVTKDLWEGIGEATGWWNINFALFWLNLCCYRSWCSQDYVQLGLEGKNLQVACLECMMSDFCLVKIGFPILTVTEDKEGILVRQDRFLETGPAQEKDNETIWYILIYTQEVLFVNYCQRTIPLAILSVDGNGKTSIDKSAVLDSREKHYPVDASRPFKLNAGTSGVCKYRYHRL